MQRSMANSIVNYYFVCYIMNGLLLLGDCTLLIPSNDNKCVSLYEKVCCVEENRGKAMIFTENDVNHYIFCPNDIPQSCVNFSTSCSDIFESNSALQSGYYNIRLTNGSVTCVYCDMDGVNCDGKGGWTRIGHLNMSDPNEQCPAGFRLYEQNGIRACGKYTSGCLSDIFPSNSINYTEVCGRVIGYQQGTPDAVHNSGSRNDINTHYVDGVSITRGNPRKHVWTYMAGLQEEPSVELHYLCPCAPNATSTPQSFIGDDYYCESGTNSRDWVTFHTDDPLWDGRQCGILDCCNVTGLPWFHKILQQPSTEYIELRVCCDQGIHDEDVPVGLYEIYIK